MAFRSMADPAMETSMVRMTPIFTVLATLACGLTTIIPSSGANDYAKCPKPSADLQRITPGRTPAASDISGLVGWIERNGMFDAPRRGVE